MLNNKSIGYEWQSVEWEGEFGTHCSNDTEYEVPDHSEFRSSFSDMGIYDHNSVVIGLGSVEGNGKLSLAMAVVFVAGYFPAFYFMDWAQTAEDD